MELAALELCNRGFRREWLKAYRTILSIPNHEVGIWYSFQRLYRSCIPLDFPCWPLSIGARINRPYDAEDVDHQHEYENEDQFKDEANYQEDNTSVVYELGLEMIIHSWILPVVLWHRRVQNAWSHAHLMTWVFLALDQDLTLKFWQLSHVNTLSIIYDKGYKEDGLVD
jgi:hypothetical protein